MAKKPPEPNYYVYEKRDGSKYCVAEIHAENSTAARNRVSKQNRIPIENLTVEPISGCFVATLVYGDTHAPEVETLREFRDDFLMDNPVGRALVDVYYSGLGKKASHYIKEWAPFSIPWIRKGLDTVVKKYRTKN